MKYFDSALQYVRAEAEATQKEARSLLDVVRKKPDKKKLLQSLRRAPRAVGAAGAVFLLLLLIVFWPAKQPMTAVIPAVEQSDLVRVTSDQEHQLKVVAAEPYAFRQFKLAIGQIAFNEDVSTTVLTPFSGRVTRVLASVGDTIKRGEPLFEIDSPEVAQAQAELLSALNGSLKAKSQLDFAKQVFDRQTGLFSDRATSQREVDQARNDYAAAESDFKTAESMLNAARNKLRVIIGRDPAEIERLERDRIINPLLTINAPIDGTVVTRKISAGQYVRGDAGDPLFTLSDLSTMWLKANVPETDIPLIRVGQELEVKVSAAPDRVFKARVISIGATSDAATHRVVVRSAIPNPDGVLKSEMFANFKILVSDEMMTLGVPSQAVIWEAENAYLWVETEPMTFRRRKVQIGLEQDGRSQVLSGLESGESVVAQGVIFINNAWRK